MSASPKLSGSSSPSWSLPSVWRSSRILFHAQTYTSPAGTQVAKTVGTVTFDGQTLQHVTLAFNTYPDSSGSVNGQPIHPGGNPSWPAYGPTNQFQVPGPRAGHRHRAPVRLGRQPQQPVVRHRARHGGQRGHGQRPARPLHRPRQRRPHLHRPGRPRHRPGLLRERAAAGGARQQPGGQRPVRNGVFSFVSGSKGIYAWNCEFPCGTSVAGFGGPMCAFGFMSGFLHVV